MKIQIINPSNTNLNYDFKDMIVEVIEETTDRWIFHYKGFDWYCRKDCAIFLNEERQTHMPRWF
jgi:hypothetical protein